MLPSSRMRLVAFKRGGPFGASESDSLYFMVARHHARQNGYGDQSYYQIMRRFGEVLGEQNSHAFNGACFNCNRHSRRARWFRRLLLRALDLTEPESVVE